MLKNSPQKPLNGKSRQDTLVDRLLARAGELGYLELVCRIKVHDGQVSQIDIEGITERLRAG